MENKYAIIIIIITIFVAIGIGTSLGALINPYKEYKDEYMQVEIPAGEDLNVVNTSNPRDYTSKNKTIEIGILSFDKSNSYSKFGYAFCRAVVESNYTQYQMSGVNYNGAVYNSSGKYIIFIFDDANKNIIALSSSNLETVIRMAKTFKLLKKPTSKLSSGSISLKTPTMKNITKYSDRINNSNMGSNYVDEPTYDENISSDTDGYTSDPDTDTDTYSDSSDNSAWWN